MQPLSYDLSFSVWARCRTSTSAAPSRARCATPTRSTSTGWRETPSRARRTRQARVERKVVARIASAADPTEEVLKVAHLTADHLDETSKREFLKFVDIFAKAWAEVTTEAAKTAAINAFAHSYVFNSALQIRMKSGACQDFYSSNMELPGGFAGVVMTTLFAGSEAANKMIESNFSGGEKGKIIGSMKVLSMRELNAPWYAGAATIMNAIIEDTKSLGGVDSYQIDIGV